MSLEIQGLDKLQRQLESASKAFEALDGEITTIKFDPNDQASIEAAIADMGRAIDSKAAVSQNNPLVEHVAAQLKAQYREQILERAAEARGQIVNTKVDEEFDQEITFRQIENAVTDLRQSDSNSFGRHIKKLSRLFHAPSLSPISQELEDACDLDAWLQAGYATRGGMVGSAKLPWPEDTKEELGLILKLVERFAEKPDDAVQFAFTFYHHSNSITNTLQHMVAQLIVPFVRDYLGYVKARTGVKEVSVHPRGPEASERRVFVVHGHDDGAKEAVARFLERIGFDPVILHEQANQGRTIMEKIEAHGGVGFAVILLTPDDEGNAKGHSPQPRARQNVLLELGYFIGRLGRDRVCALKRGEIEIPSDFVGVVYETFDANGAWKMTLARELKALGFDIDLNRV